jgi:Aspartyl protease
MRDYLIQSMRIIFFSIWVVVILVLSEPLQTNAQQTRNGTSARTSRQAVPTVRFDSGDSALKIPLDIDNNIIRIQVNVNHSKPLKFIFDTGASLSVISSKRAAELGLKSQGRFSGDATGGRIQGDTIEGVELGVQGAKVSKLTVASFPFPTPPGFEFDGIIGCDFIKQFVVEVDYLKRTMNLYNPRTYRYVGRGKSVPLILIEQNTPLVSAKILLAGRAPFKLKLEVDTGGDNAVLVNSPFAKRHKLVEAMQNTTQNTRNGGGGTEHVVTGQANAVKLGSFTLKNVPIQLSLDTEGAGASEEKDGLIGGEIFRRFKVTFDYSRKRMILEPNKSFNDPYNLEGGRE